MEQPDLRAHLPGLEPERQVTDWGRSERASRLLDGTLYAFLYESWFRIEVDGIEHLPDRGGALLLPLSADMTIIDAAMIARAVALEHPHARRVQVLTQRDFAGVPGLGMLAAKLGVVAAHAENLHRLLFDEAELVLAIGAAGRKLAGAAPQAGVPLVRVAIERRGRGSLLAGLPRGPLPIPDARRVRFLEPVAQRRLTAESQEPACAS